MAENRNKKKRIAHIGNMANALVTTNLHCDDELAQADCDLVYNIMQSMEKSQNAVSYQQLQENRSKDKEISRTNDSKMKSRKRNNKSPRSSKQLKKNIPEKSFPLMAKCQKSMKYLKKNRCIPKPRAHVGSLQGLLPIPTSNFKSNYNNNSISNNTVNFKDRTMNIKQCSKKSGCSSDLNAKQKKKIPHSPDKSCGEDTFQTESFEKETKGIGDTDSDNEFEKFLQKHHPEKYSASYNNSGTRIARRNIKNTNKTKKKRNKRLKCDTKISKVTSKKLSDFEESAESERECIENNHKAENSCSRQFLPKKFRRIIEHTNSDDSASDTYLNDSGILNYDSSSSARDENLLNKSTDKETVRDAINLDNSGRLSVLPSVPNSNALFELKNALSCNELKFKLKPCSVLLKRDPALDKKAASLQNGNSSLTNMVPFCNLYDDDDCCIISETSTNDFISQESQNIRQSVEQRNPSQRKSAVLSESSISEAFPELDGTQDKSMCTGKLKDSSSCELRTQTDTSSLISNSKSAKNLFEFKSIEKQGNEKVSRSVDTTKKSALDTTKDESSIVNKVTTYSNENINSIECEEKGATSIKSLTRHTSDLSKDETRVSLNSNRPTSTEKEIFNVQILSVKSLNESDVVILSDDDEEKDSKTIPSINVTNENVAEDSDIEIICLDSVIDKKKSVNENAKEVLKNEIHNKVDTSLKENSSCSSVQPMVLDEEDCIILDVVDLPIEKHAVKNADKMQQSSQMNVISDHIIKIEKENSNKGEETISDKKVDTGNTILKILDTIDFNCIKKVLNETTITDTQKVENSESISAIAEDTLCDVNQTSKEDGTVDSFPKKRKQSQNDTSFPSKPTLIDVNVTPVGNSEVNIRSVETSPVNTQEHNFVKNSNVPHKIIKNDSENMQDSPKSNISSSRDCDKSSTFLNSSTDLVVPKLSICEKEIIASDYKTKQDVTFHAGKNQQMLPVYPKMESYESPFDELDIIAAKSIQNLGEHETKTVLPLLDLYRAEYKKFMEIKCTEQNVSAGLKLLEEQQAKKLMVISSSIKNLVKNDGCFHKVNNEFRNNQTEHKSFAKISHVKKDESLDEKKPLESIKPLSNGNYCDIEKDDKVRIFHPSIVEKASEVIKSKTVGPSSSREVYNHLINCVCAECGKHAAFACLGCAKIYYCSEKCGMSSWSKGHYATCRK
ncbi:uncharacterized protein LOC129961782 [Argiope bruennichi]|uniref:uncharacterized protein LOC129961782 n=1 Tax=Argiope bruennichi TaxID=94029 RepID=UPI00249453F8|nr:uncharacterized protein LOC129961782 [Argiope bruennichi]